MKTILNITSVGILAATLLCSQVVRAEELDPIFTKVKTLVSSGDYSKALEELKWASKEIEKLNAKKIETFFPDSLNGFTGSKINTGGALGMTNIERTYMKGKDGFQIALTNLGSAAGGALGGLAQLGSMAAMFGGQNGIESVRINGRTAQLDSTGSEPKLTLFLDGGSMLNVEGKGAVKTEDLKAAIEAMKIDDLEKYLKGA
jgi:hypothetical protein